VSSAESIRRTEEIEEVTNRYFIHPTASRLVPLFAKAHITPNAVSLTGMLFGILAGLAYYRYRELEWTLAGFLLMLAWHVMDGADGQLARLTRSYSHFGKVLDGISDTVTFVAVYTALGMALSHEYGVGIYALVILSGMCHAVQSASYELERQQYDSLGRGRREPAARQRDRSDGRLIDRLFQRLDRLFYAGLSFPVAGITAKVREALTAALELQPECELLIRQRYREIFAPHLRQWSVLSANYRTLGIFLAALLRAPQYYFAFETVGFSAILAWLIQRQSTRYGRFLRAIEELGSD
jgi:CDP-diacylglycerol---serine O-phosphatidyltransferase